MASRTERIHTAGADQVSLDIVYDDITRIPSSYILRVGTGTKPLRFVSLNPNGTVRTNAVYQPGTTTTIPIPTTASLRYTLSLVGNRYVGYQYRIGFEA